MTMVIVSLVRDHGPEYLMAATILCGIIMSALGVLKVGNLLKLIPNSVNIGFVNALGIMIFTSQLGNFEGEGWQMYDAGVASQTFCLSAYDKGIGSVILGIFDFAKVAELLEVPEDRDVIALIPIGYPDEAPVAPRRKAVEDLLSYK